MKKLTLILLSVLLVFTFAACGGTEETADVFTFKLGETTIVPGEKSDLSKLPEPDAISEITSCAFDGVDKVMTYKDKYEITAHIEGDDAIVYSVFLFDPNLKTQEGLSMGETKAKMIEIYGENFTQDGDGCIYTKGKTQLIMILQDDVIISIEYRQVI